MTETYILRYEKKNEKVGEDIFINNNLLYEIIYHHHHHHLDSYLDHLY